MNKTYRVTPKTAFNLFHGWLGAGVYVIAFLSVIAAVIESLGITTVLALLPFIISGDESQASGAVYSTISSILSSLGIKYSPLYLLILIILAFMVKGVLNYITFSLNAYLRAKLLVKLKSDLIEYVSTIDYQEFMKKESGSFVNLINEQVSKSLHCFYHMCHLVGQSGNTIIYILFGLATSLIFGIISGLTGLVLLLVFKKLNHQVRIASVETAYQNGNLSNQIIDLVQNLKYFKILNGKTFIDEEIKLSVQKLGKNQLRSGVAIALSQAVKEPVIFVFVIVGFAISYEIFAINIEIVLVSMLFFYRALNSILSVQGNYQKFLENVGSLNLLHEELFEFQKPKSTNLQNTETIKHNPHSQYSVEFDKVLFNYKQKENIIFQNPLSFKIQTNRHIAIVGKSGEGKTTILDLITGVIKPVNGEIKWFGSSVQPEYTDITFGYINQEYSVFNGTIRQNITLGKSDSPSSEQWLLECIEAASLQGLIASLPSGLDTPLGERGLGLSGGQRQRLVIARELYKKPDILLMDEATSALDNATEKLVRKSIQNLHGNITVILVAHRVQTLQYVDEIFVIKSGKIVERGTYEDLHAQDASYFNQIFPKIES